MRWKKMSRFRVNLFLLTILLTPLVSLFVLNKFLTSSKIFNETNSDFDWIRNGIKNLLGYTTILLPGYLTYTYVRKTEYLGRAPIGFVSNFLRLCFGEDGSMSSPLITHTDVQRIVPKKSFWWRTFLLVFYFTGLQVSYLSWGIIQEKVMTQVYESSDGRMEYFGDSQFLVFVNRILAFLISGVILLCRKRCEHKCPFYKYVFCSFSNIMSSWCQYEALKYVSFPHQVLAKAAKTIPVMLMGKLISKTQYKYYEYITSITLSIGMLLFMVDVGNDKARTNVTTISGALLLISYIIFDSFTSNWQSSLFKNYSISPVQMMCFVNFFSFILTGTSLIQQSSFYVSLNFLLKYPSFSLDCILLSLCSALGQLFIFSTISEFGPLVFVIISTIRQCLSVLLSCIFYKHEVHALGVFGLSFVFWSVFLRIYCSYRSAKKRSNRLKGYKSSEDQKF
ncbi:adenosine 3'-phospho 5'-phosphosulfate transporter 1 [Coccinella septempunctata]|uniref:adenosine 3'-phospho 5'-phosphosulfate transporter 1 n=1 Tax=Coccinella septempunctata TaxID=41139 RepID=UPI001D078FA8|nr:adenosine 3'-phospho 5'-phosphosulfate transporter 1 [Coccinella septempunctata]